MATNNPVRDFGMSPTGGWTTANGDFTTVAGRPAVIQGAQIRVSTIKTEIWLDEALGVDYLNKILIKDPDPLEVRAELAAQFLSVPDVTDVVGAQLQGPTPQRQASINFQLSDLYGSDPVASKVNVP